MRTLQFSRMRCCPTNLGDHVSHMDTNGRRGQESGARGVQVPAPKKGHRLRYGARIDDYTCIYCSNTGFYMCNDESKR
jgi:hypothetical protein